MKKLLFSVFTLLLFTNSFAQTSDNVKRQAIGISFFMNDFTTAADIKNNGLAMVLRSKNLFRSTRMNPGLAINYLKGLSSHLDFAATLGGSYVVYPIPNHTPFGDRNFLLEATASVNAKLLSDQYWVVPYANLGAGLSKYLNNYAAFLPVGVGVQVNIFSEAFIFIN